MLPRWLKHQMFHSKSYIWYWLNVSMCEIYYWKVLGCGSAHFFHLYSVHIEVHNSFADILQMWLCTFLLLTFSRCDSAHFFYWYSPDMAVHISFTAVFQTWQCTFLLLILSISFTDILQLQTNPDPHRQSLWTCVTWKWLMQTSQM